MHRWSCRCRPTAGQSCTTAMPRCARSPRRADAGELQQQRRVDRAAADDDFARGARGGRDAIAHVVDAGRARAVEERCAWRAHASRRAGWAAQRRMQIRARRRHAPAVARRDLVEADAFLRRAVEVVVARQAQLAARAQEHVAQRMHVARDVGHRQRPAARRATRRARACCPPACGNTAARRTSPSPDCPSAAMRRNRPAARG